MAFLLTEIQPLLTLMERHTGKQSCLCKLGREWYASMSFTPDELQALHAILDQKTAELLSELEQSFDRKIQGIRQEFAQQQQQLADSIEHSFATQLLAFEQLLNQHCPATSKDSLSPLQPPQPLRVPTEYTNQPQTSFEAIEVQTEIPWEDLIDLLNTALNERFITFNTSLQTRLQDAAYAVSSQIQLLRDELHREQPIASSSGIPSGQRTANGGQGRRDRQGHAAVPTSLPTSLTEAEMQDILASINQLESIVESMQVAMTANNTLISNRLHHHQHLPVERAHPSRSLSPTEHETLPAREWNVPPLPPEETQA